MKTIYGQGFTLDFAYCTNCGFHQDAKDGRDLFGEFELKETLARKLERKHDVFFSHCQKRELVISYNRVMTEKGK